MGDRNEKYRQKFTEAVQPHIEEPVIAVGQLTPRGAAGAAGMMAGVSGLAGGIMRSQAKKNAGDLPHIGVYALTPTTLHVFDVKPRGTGIKIKKHVAAFPREVFRAQYGQGAITDQIDLVFTDGTVISLEAISLGAKGFNDPFFAQLIGG